MGSAVYKACIIIQEPKQTISEKLTVIPKVNGAGLGQIPTGLPVWFFCILFYA